MFLDQLPTNAGAKLKRIGMAERLGFTEAAISDLGAVEFDRDVRSADERALADIWQEILSVRAVGLHDDFVSLGGDSMLAAALLVQIGERLGVWLTYVDLMVSPTFSEVALRIAAGRKGSSACESPIEPAPVSRHLATRPSASIPCGWRINSIATTPSTTTTA